MNVFAEAIRRNGNFTPGPETQTLSILMLIFMGSPFKPQRISTTVGEALSPVDVSRSKAFKEQPITQWCCTHQNLFPPNASASVLPLGCKHLTIPVQPTSTCTCSRAGSTLKLRFVSDSAWNDWVRAEQTKTKGPGSHGLCFM